MVDKQKFRLGRENLIFILSCDKSRNNLVSFCKIIYRPAFYIIPVLLCHLTNLLNRPSKPEACCCLQWVFSRTKTWTHDLLKLSLAFSPSSYPAIWQNSSAQYMHLLCTQCLWWDQSSNRTFCCWDWRITAIFLTTDGPKGPCYLVMNWPKYTCELCQNVWTVHTTI